MAEYIKRDALKAAFEEDGHLSAYVEEMIEGVPADDVINVVRCRDCKYWFNAPAADGFNSCEQDALIRHENFFCAAGEKREEN